MAHGERCPCKLCLTNRRPIKPSPHTTMSSKIDEDMGEGDKKRQSECNDEIDSAS